MKTHLVKLHHHNIIISDQEIKEGDCILYTSSGIPVIYKNIHIDSTFERQREECVKIIGSSNLFHNLPSINYNGFEGFLRIVDVEKLAEDFSNEGAWQCPVSFEKGFRTAQSLSEKRFTEQDIREALQNAFAECYCEDGSLIGKSPVNSFKWINNYLQSLQQPKVYDIDIEKSYHGKIWEPKYYRPKITNNQITITNVI